jgi:hypothetical protein
VRGNDWVCSRLWTFDRETFGKVPYTSHRLAHAHVRRTRHDRARELHLPPLSSSQLQSAHAVRGQSPLNAATRTKGRAGLDRRTHCRLLSAASSPCSFAGLRYAARRRRVSDSLTRWRRRWRAGGRPQYKVAAGGRSLAAQARGHGAAAPEAATGSAAGILLDLGVGPGVWPECCVCPISKVLSPPPFSGGAVASVPASSSPPSGRK